jgi:hypothetical protein
MYTILPQPVSTARLGSWEKPLGRFTQVLGYSALGTIFVRDPADGTYVALHPLMAGNNATTLGKFASTAEFEKQVLGDPAKSAAWLRPADVAALQKRLGKLGAAEVYYPVPYPMLGGSGALETYEKGEVWTFADLVGQSIGLGGDDDDEEPPRDRSIPTRGPFKGKKISNTATMVAIVVFIAICFFLLKLLK